MQRRGCDLLHRGGDECCWHVGGSASRKLPGASTDASRAYPCAIGLTGRAVQPGGCLGDAIEQLNDVRQPECEWQSKGVSEAGHDAEKLVY